MPGTPIRNDSIPPLSAILLGFALAACHAEPPPPAPTCSDEPGAFHDCFAFSGIADLTAHALTNAAAVADLDGDGKPEVLTFTVGAPARLWRNLGGFRFSELTGTGLDLGGATGVRIADIDGDGRLDVVATAVDVGDNLMPRQQGLRAWRGLDGLKFEEKTSDWGLDQLPALGGSVLLGLDLADVNGDGILDIAPRRHVAADGQVLLFLSEPGPHFREAGHELYGDVAGNAFTTLFADANGDGWDDAFIIFDHGGTEYPPARLFVRTPGAPAFTEDTQLVPDYFGAQSVSGDLMGAAFADADADGHLELFLSDIGAQHLLRHDGSGPFVNVAADAHADVPAYPQGGNTVVYSPAFADFTNDGFPDLLLPCSTDGGNRAPPTPFFLENQGDGTFRDLSAAIRESGPTSEQGLSLADFDGDGRLDAFLGGVGRPPRLMRNAFPSGGFVNVRLRGSTSNREGIGARVIATFGGKPHAFHLAASGIPYGDSPHAIHLGLGAASQVDALEIHWPSGLVQQAGPVAAGQNVEITEPPFVTLDRTMATADESVTITIAPPGTSTVTATLEPENTDIALESSGSQLQGTVRAAPGLHGIRIEVDGHVIPARPQLLVH